jgi:hypothetical protein
MAFRIDEKFKVTICRKCVFVGKVGGVLRKEELIERQGI